jgi:DNA-binding PadR family transcriptional regulator
MFGKAMWNHEFMHNQLHEHARRHFHEHGHGWEAGRGGRPPWAGAGRGFRRGGGDWFGDFFGPPPRAERGGVRYLVLDAIAKQARHGYEVIQAIEERSKGAYRPSPGVVYPTLQLLEELGHARVVEQDARKVYSITEEGTRDLGEHADEVSDFYDRSDDDAWERHLEDFSELMHKAARLFKTFKRALRRGSISVKAQAGIREVLDNAVKKIEEILADDQR